MKYKASLQIQLDIDTDYCFVISENVSFLLSRQVKIKGLLG